MPGSLVEALGEQLSPAAAPVGSWRWRRVAAWGTRVCALHAGVRYDS